ncbi:M61 family metallopeptidase [Mucilaginibacter ginsenosidivorans]|nr:PDZ domain-containing protein [Mucilaginibacter ginsenosidivorans]
MNSTTGKATGSVNISYTITFPEAQAHYADVEMNITGLQQKTLILKMPVWTPGSYLVREYSKNVESFTAEVKGKAVAAEKIRKNAWRINTENVSAVKVRYRVYSFELSVRTSFIDAAHAFLSNAGIFIYPDGMLHHPSTIHIVPYKGWTKVSTSLDKVNGDPFTLYSPDYDILFDSPIEVGNQDVFGFKVGNTEYEVAMCGAGNYDKDKLTRDMPKIIEHEAAIYGENPNKRYVFIVHNTSRGGGGLEHLSSTVLGASRENYATERGYQGFLSLVAHEHFHLWNVKRLRPIVLGPFDYDNENYTTDLWIAEGFTAYYQDIIIRRTNLYPVENYLGVLAADINYVANQPGNKIQTLAEASYDAWIKYYRPNENSPNTNISYYNKGSIMALMFDLEIINDTKGKYSLDDVMHYMYHTYYKTLKRGYTDKEFKQGVEKFAGKNLDEFYRKYVYGLEDIDFDKYLGYAGYHLTDEFAGTNEPSLGIVTQTPNGRIFVSTVMRNSSAWVDGINVGDEIVAVDSAKVTDVNAILNGKKVGDKINISVLRDGLPLTLPVTLLKRTQVKYKIDSVERPSEQQMLVRKKWLSIQ